jgi:hypothetical protein
MAIANLCRPAAPASPDFIPFPFGRRSPQPLLPAFFFSLFSFKNYFMKNANNNFRDYTGTENWYRHFTGLLYTDGVQAVAETYQAYWLIDLVFSHQLSPAVKAQPFQKWVLQRTQGDAFMATCDDGNGNIITGQAIPFSDFKEDILTLYLTEGVLLLPSEY